MMKKILASLMFTAFSSLIYAQINTPGTGVRWNMDSLAAHFPAAVTKSGNLFSVTEPLTFIERDTFFLDQPVSVHFDSAATMEFVKSAILIHADSAVVFAAADTSKGFARIRLDSVSHASLDHFELWYGSGISLIASSASLRHCQIAHSKHTGTNPSGALSLLRSNIEIDSSSFIENARSAITVGATGLSGLKIVHSRFLFNNYQNGNYPQINIGTANDSGVLIRDCMIEGKYNRAGAIGFLNVTNADYTIEVSNNTLKNNRYGIAVTGRGISGYIMNNVIDSNNTEGLPMLGGSGLNFQGDSSIHIIASGNTIRHNLWGVTVQPATSSAPRISLGKKEPVDLLDVGENEFAGNGHNDTLYSVYNNTADTVWAQNNSWDFSTADSIEMTIFHYPDNDTLGWVIFDPFRLQPPTTIETVVPTLLAEIYPNPVPSGSRLHIRTTEPIRNISIFDIQGRKIQTHIPAARPSEVTLNMDRLQPGVYFIKITAAGGEAYKKMVVW